MPSQQLITTVELKGLPGLKRKIAKLNRFEREELDPMVKNFMQARRRELMVKPYPPERPGQRYIRTHALGNSYTTRKLSTARYAIGTRVPYGRYVVDEENQAWMHRGRWWTIQEVIRENLPKLKKSIERKLKEIWNAPTG